ncbi:MAG: helix-turn-helix domain-containing protein [Bauldia sp.]|nr:helix-turn-helix domain-containing protein [Bauldia sp.]
MTGTAKSPRSSNAAAFAKRIDKALSGYPQAPSGHGRLAWLHERLAAEGVKLSRQAVSAWFSGRSIPVPSVMRVLARVLNVDYPWLALGERPTSTTQEVSKRSFVREGVVSYVGGFIQIGGGQVAPGADPDGGEDILAIIKGQHLSIEVKLARELSEDRYSVDVFKVAPRHIALAAVVSETGHPAILMLTADAVSAHGKWRGGFFEFNFTKAGKKFTIGETAIPVVNSVGDLIK